jgi:hypothetical protein
MRQSITFRGPDLRPDTRCRVLRRFTFREERLAPNGELIAHEPVRVVEPGEIIRTIGPFAHGWAQAGRVEIIK